MTKVIDRMTHPSRETSLIYDLVLKQARVIDYQAELDKVWDIAFKGSSVAIIQDTSPASEALESHDLTGCLVCARID